MIDAISYLILILLSVGLSHAILPYDYRNRLFWIVAPGIFLLFVVHPLALLFALACFVCSVAIFIMGRAMTSSRMKTRIPYAILLLLFVPDIVRLADQAPVLWLGSAFFIVRQMMTVTQGIKNALSVGEFIPALLISTFFFAALPAGPVFNGSRTWGLLKHDSVPAYGEGCFRLFEGFTYLFAFSGIVAMFIKELAIAEMHMPESIGFPGVLLLKFVAEPLSAFCFLFATFYGYSRMAEGSAILLGFEVPQNFNKPHLARDLGDFWKRWHRSMADFVMQYIYLPLLVTTSKTRLALIAAFVFMGLWHNFSLGFLVWGIGHGVGLAYLLPWGRRKGYSATLMRTASLMYVIVLSAIAHGVWSQ